MFIEGSVASNKTELLVDNYSKLLNSGISSQKILVLVQNSNLKNDFINKTFQKLNIESVEKLQVHSFYSLVYNTVCDNWAFLEDRNNFGSPVILPNLAGLEVSQFILKDILKEVKFKGYNSGISLLHQIFRRYSLIVQNNLTRQEVEERSKILKEGFSSEANVTIKKLLKKTLELRDFDYIRQCLLFNFIYQNTDYFKNIEYLILDDADEFTPICIDFIKYLAPQLKDVFIAIDPKGSSRCGYLSADKNNYHKLHDLFKCDIQVLDSVTKLKIDSDNLYRNVYENTRLPLKHFTNYSFSKRTEIIEDLIKKINSLLEQRVDPCDISVVTPMIDNMLKFTLKENLKKVSQVYLSGNEKLIQNSLVYAVITILKLNTSLKKSLTEFDIRIILSKFLKIPLKNCSEILAFFEKKKELPDFIFSDSEYDERYQKFKQIIDDISNSGKKLSEQIVEIYNRLFIFEQYDKNEINKFSFFLKQVCDFEMVFGERFNSKKAEIITQIENSIIAENPYSVLEIDKKDLIISTPQKIIDNQIKTKYQIWLDISNSEWIKQDTGPLYNAWVFQKDWSKDKYTIEDNIELSKEKTARCLRKLSLCAKEHVYCYSSLFDSNGIENFGAIEDYIVAENQEQEIQSENVNNIKIVPRQDQQPVLDYKKGFMGISAVPGAGKTTILLLLILRLLDRGVDPEHIFVLTYMDSAARNFRQRIKNVYKNSQKMPNISTIHGLALKILKENSNYERLGLNADFDICDDSQRNRILKEISANLKIEMKEVEQFDKGISVFKMSGAAANKSGIPTQKLNNFLKFYREYQTVLNDLNLIDYDDMLLGAVKILEQNSDVLLHYQEICEYIIEDEAQDSSAIQQKLINLLSGQHKNVIRCGDVNQSITSTFSNSDVEGFRKFITENKNVSMNCSQRCAKNVWELANTLVKKSISNKDSSNAFFEMYMHPVEGKNPADDTGIFSQIFETDTDEKNTVLQQIKKVLQKHPNYTIGILLRNNYQVGAWQNLLESSGLKVITRNQCLEQKRIFRAIFSCLDIILNPFNNDILAHNYDILADLGVYQRALGKEISAYENPFITINADNLNNQSLEQFFWDVNYWISLCFLTPDELVIKLAKTLKIFNSEIEKANIYLISTLVKRICIKNNSLNYVYGQLKELAKKPNLNGIKFFSEEDEEDKKNLQGKIQIMTMHKSKGDEFNVVFLPEMSERNLSLSINSINLKSSDFIESVKALNKNYQKKSDYEQKREILEENLRLLYVAITRAKNKLYFSASRKVKNYGKLKNEKVSVLFDNLLEGIYVE